MTTQTLRGLPVEIIVINAEGRTDADAILNPREVATVEAVDAVLQATQSFQTSYPQACLLYTSRCV